MIDDMIFNKAIGLIADLRNSRKLCFDMFIPMNIKGTEDIKGAVGDVYFGGSCYRFKVYAHRQLRLIKVDIDLRIAPKAEYRKLLLTFLLNINLMADYDYTFAMNKSGDVHILGQMDYKHCVFELRSLELIFLNLLDIMKQYRKVICMVAYGHDIPFIANDAASTDYYIFCNPKYLIVPQPKRKNLSECLCKDYINLIPRYIRIDEKEFDSGDDSPFP